MRWRWFTLPVLVLAVVVGAPALASAGQQPSLAELSRREAERRKAVKAPAKVYTNDDVPKGTLTVTAPPPLEEAKSGADEAAPAANEKAPDEAVKDEAYWRQRFATARADLATEREALEATQSRLRVALEHWAVAQDAERRAEFEEQRDDAAVELTKAREAVETRQQALAALEKEADAASVPASWRE